LEANNSNESEFVGRIHLADHYQVAHIQLNCTETNLIVIGCKQNENSLEFQYVLNVFDLETISFDSKKFLQV
jgi:hypothetical protein